MNMNNIRKLLVLFTVSLFLSCVYSFQSGSFKGAVSIPPLENKTNNADIERILTEDLIDAFIKDGRVKIKPDGDYILNGVITDYNRKVESYTSEGEIKEYRLMVKVKFSLAKISEEEPEWEKDIQESVVYPISSDETEGVESVASEIKDSLLRLMLESW